MVRPKNKYLPLFAFILGLKHNYKNSKYSALFDFWILFKMAEREDE